MQAADVAVAGSPADSFVDRVQWRESVCPMCVCVGLIFVDKVPLFTKLGTPFVRTHYNSVPSQTFSGGPDSYKRT